MFSHLSESIAEIVYDFCQGRAFGEGESFPEWDNLPSHYHEEWLKVADEILDVFDQDNLYELEERNL